MLLQAFFGSVVFSFPIGACVLQELVNLHSDLVPVLRQDFVLPPKFRPFPSFWVLGYSQRVRDSKELYFGTCRRCVALKIPKFGSGVVSCRIAV